MYIRCRSNEINQCFNHGKMPIKQIVNSMSLNVTFTSAKHGTITSFKVYIPSRKSHSFKTTKMFHYTVSAVCVVFLKSWQRRKVLDSLSCVQWRANESRDPPPPVGASSQWESAVCMMMAVGDESLQLFHCRKTWSLPYRTFSFNVD